MTRVLLEPFRDEDGDWTSPSGRAGEFLVLLVGLPIFAWFAAVDLGGLAVGDGWFALAVGVWAGFAYAAFFRERLLEAVPDDLGGWTLVSLFTGGFGLSILEVVHLGAPTALFVLAAGATVLAVSMLRLVSPLHDGMEPQRRGVEPPASVDVER
ncbi:hypothetical protein C491_02760 [Natronococcus amylolyticus DSM 10524]|uniref:Uncharacterized protein n=1 Tax=Natronococcus amylolyticus DSM 10524 TaxID=1227497 RepID=L9XEN7_9EURY|nr:hypothetical protein [Natronococcus amylolyticus]ELY60184.1 hypothetical protein C491_02760 [Natronococcus amylolyticus DSM 10524]